MSYFKFLKDNVLYILGTAFIIAGIVGFLHHLVHFAVASKENYFEIVDIIAMSTSAILITTGSATILYSLAHDYKFIKRDKKE